jgi:hypothetical protein
MPNNIPDIPTGPIVEFDVDDRCNTVIASDGNCSWTEDEMNTIQAAAVLKVR